jgi:hypothetical protein
MPDRDEAISSGQPFARLGPPQSATGQKMAAENLLRAAKNVSPARLVSLAEDLRGDPIDGSATRDSQTTRPFGLKAVTLTAVAERISKLIGVPLTLRRTPPKHRGNYGEWYVSTSSGRPAYTGVEREEWLRESGLLADDEEAIVEEVAR